MPFRRYEGILKSLMTNYRTLSPEQLCKWAEDNTEIMRLRTDLDLLPGGYMAALAPMLPAWNESSYLGADGFLLLRSINYGGNTFELQRQNAVGFMDRGVSDDDVGRDFRQRQQFGDPSPRS